MKGCGFSNGTDPLPGMGRPITLSGMEGGIFLTAYVDPGAGGLLLQIIFGGLAGLAVVIKLQWSRIAGFFRRKSR